MKRTSRFFYFRCHLFITWISLNFRNDFYINLLTFYVFCDIIYAVKEEKFFGRYIFKRKGQRYVEENFI